MKGRLTINEVDPHPYWEPANGFGVVVAADVAADAGAAGGVGDVVAAAGVADADAAVVEVGAVASYKHCIYLYLKPARKQAKMSQTQHNNLQRVAMNQLSCLANRSHLSHLHWLMLTSHVRIIIHNTWLLIPMHINHSST